MCISKNRFPINNYYVKYVYPLRYVVTLYYPKDLHLFWMGTDVFRLWAMVLLVPLFFISMLIFLVLYYYVMCFDLC